MVGHRGPLRLALVVSSLRTGGAERVISTLANYWSRSGQCVGLITLEGPGSDAFAVDRAVERIALDQKARALSTKSAVMRTTVKRMWTLRAALADFRPDVVISFGDVMNILVLLASYNTRLPVVVSERTDPRHHRIGRMWVILRWLLYRRASALVAQTHSVRSWAETIVDPDHVVVIPNPVPAATRMLRRSRQGDSSLGLRVVGMGRLSAEKGFDLLIHAFARLRGKFPDWSLTIFGEGPARGDLEDLVHQLGLQKVVRLPGETRSPELELRQASLFVLSSRYEGFPNVLLEAMAAGLPVIAVDCPSGPAEIIEHGVSGMLVPLEDEVALARAMESLMADSSMRQRLGGEAVREMERFHIDRVMALWADVLRNATGGKLQTN